MNVDPPSLLIEAITSVFKVVLETSSWNTTILEVEGAELAVNAFETIVVLVVTGADDPVTNTKPSSPAFDEFVGSPPPSHQDEQHT